MDTLTARLMARSGLSNAARPPARSTPMVKAGIGLNPSNPLLPPVHNVRMIYLKEPFGDAEKDLHAARVALKALETTNDPATRKALYKAMAKLQGKESHYFATKYIGRDKPLVLSGWNTLFTDKVKELAQSAVRRLLVYQSDALVSPSARESDAITILLSEMNRDRLDPKKWNLPRARYENDLAKIKTKVATIDAVRQTMTIGSHTRPQSNAINRSFHEAEQCARLAKLLVDNVRIVPPDMM